jgi:molybdopterin/thiamine biosynthesis adenylyltransferase
LKKTKKEKMAKEKADNRKVRFSDAPWANSPQHIVVGGVGGIGSWASLYLARIGHLLYMYDMDRIDETNMGGQLYQISQIGMNKAEAAAANIKAFCGDDASVKTYERYTEEEGFVTPVMFSCFDNMAARKAMFDKWANYDKREAFIDGRMLAEVGMVYLVQKGQEEEYRKTLFDDAEVEEAPCSFKATSHCGGFIGAKMVSALNNYLANKASGFDDRIVPFKSDFELPLMMVDAVEFTALPKEEPKKETKAEEKPKAKSKKNKKKKEQLETA